MKKFSSEFKEFINRGNVVDMAVGVIIGGAFTAIVNSLVNDMLMPLISLITGGVRFEEWSVTLGSGPQAAVINFGLFISAIINFLLVALTVFLLVKFLNRMRKNSEKAEDATTKDCPFCKSSIPVAASRCPHCTSALED